jgi:hypothetical protein
MPREGSLTPLPGAKREKPAAGKSPPKANGGKTGKTARDGRDTKEAKDAKDAKDGRGSRRRPRAKLQAQDDEAQVAEWASLLGDLARGTEPRSHDAVEWRIHDRTHLEFAIDYTFGPKAQAYTWEAFFFLPESLRIQETTYDKKDIYEDLLSYIRFAVPEIPLALLAQTGPGTELDNVRQALLTAKRKPDGCSQSAGATRALRLFACLVRSSGVAAMREVQEHFSPRRADPAELGPLVVAFSATCGALAHGFRDVIAEAKTLGLPDEVVITMRWADEDISLVLETLSATLAVQLEEAASRENRELHDLAEMVAARAVSEARHRAERGYDSLGAATASERQIEHLEFRRHVLKRFTSSVLWLTLDVRERNRWIEHTFYALAAAAAMGFAVAAAFQSNKSADSVYKYSVLVIVAYAIKDRMKAYLQGVFTGYIARRFPDRNWIIRDRDTEDPVGSGDERAGFLEFRHVPADVLKLRRLTREHALEEQARPERVLWHRKSVVVARPDGAAALEVFPMLTEIYRLNVRQWLNNTDDPNRKVTFADPRDARIYSAKARRVYNVNVVYRLTHNDGADGWHRLRLVVSRKGIERIDTIR